MYEEGMCCIQGRTELSDKGVQLYPQFEKKNSEKKKLKKKKVTIGEAGECSKKMKFVLK
jgi:hypothetical protein